MTKDKKAAIILSVTAVVCIVAFIAAKIYKDDKDARIKAEFEAQFPVEQNEPRTNPSYNIYCRQLRSYGAADAFVRPGTNILTYVVRKGELSTSGYSVAKTMYEDAVASGCYGLEGCDVLELPDSTRVGRYRK